MTSLWSPLWRTLWLMAHFVMWWRHIGWWLIHITWPLYVLPLYKFHQINFSILYAFTCDWINELTIVHWSIFGTIQKIWTNFASQLVELLKHIWSVQSAACPKAKLFDYAMTSAPTDFQSLRTKLNNLVVQQPAACTDRKGLSGFTSWTSRAA